MGALLIIIIIIIIIIKHLKEGLARKGGGVYWKESAKSNNYGNYGFGGHLDE